MLASIWKVRLRVFPCAHTFRRFPSLPSFISAILHYKSEGGEVPCKYLLRLSAAQTLGKVCFILQRIGGERKKKIGGRTEKDPFKGESSYRARNQRKSRNLTFSSSILRSLFINVINLAPTMRKKGQRGWREETGNFEYSFPSLLARISVSLPLSTFRDLHSPPPYE